MNNKKKLVSWHVVTFLTLVSPAMSYLPLFPQAPAPFPRLGLLKLPAAAPHLWTLLLLLQPPGERFQWPKPHRCLPVVLVHPMRRITSTHLPRLAYTTWVSHSDPKAGRVAEVPAHRRPLIPVSPSWTTAPGFSRSPDEVGMWSRQGPSVFLHIPSPKASPVLDLLQQRSSSVLLGEFLWA